MKSTNDTPIFNYYAPIGEFKALISIPHSGEYIPEEFKNLLITDIKEVSIDVDTAVDKLVEIERLNQAGIGVLVANIHRACVDLNRSPDLAVLAWEKNSQGKQIVTTKLDQEQKDYFLGKYHSPYFTFLKALIEKLEHKFAKPSIIDLHSMPSTATEYHLKITPNQKIDRPDFCISDISGQSCEPEFIKNITTKLTDHNYLVTNNDPYFGGYITRRIHQLFPNVNNIQIEIKRGIYLDETSRTLENEKVGRLKPILTKELINFCEDFNQ